MSMTMTCKRKQPLWRIRHATGEHRGHMIHFSDHGGTDVTYQFLTHCGQTLVVSGSYLKASGVLRAEDDDGTCPHDGAG